MASDVIASVGGKQSDPEVLAAKHELAHAVGAARDLEVSWQTIGDALGMAEAISWCLAEVPVGLIVDLEEATFLSSTGAGALVDADGSARSGGKRLAIAAQSVTVSRTLSMMGVDEILDHYPTVHAAMVGLHATADDDARAPRGDDGQA